MSTGTITLPAPYDRQVATGFPAVEALRSGRARLAAARRAADRAARYRDWVLDTFLTTTPAGREGRQKAVDRYEEALRDLAAAEAELPSLAEEAERQCPAAATRLTLSAEAYAAYARNRAREPRAVLTRRRSSPHDPGCQETAGGIRATCANAAPSPGQGDPMRRLAPHTVARLDQVAALVRDHTRDGPLSTNELAELMGLNPYERGTVLWRALDRLTKQGKVSPHPPRRRRLPTVAVGRRMSA